MSNQEKAKTPEEGRIDVVEFIVDYLRIAKRMIAWFVIFSILGAGLFHVKARMQYIPVYTASATFTINMRTEQSVNGMSSSTYLDNTTAEQMAKTFPYILTSGVLKRKVADDMGTAVTSSISAEVVENTNLLIISVTDRDAGVAYATLQSVVENYPSVSEVIIGKINMEMLDETGIPPQPDNPKDFGSETLKGFILGIMIAAAWVLLLVFTRRTVRKKSDIYKMLHTSCLGTIPDIPKKRRTRDAGQQKLLFTEEKYQGILQEPMRIIRNKIEYYASQYEHRVFIITSAIAGEGKSTIAVNVALSLAAAGKKVALIDCDLRHPTDEEIFGIKKGPGLSDILLGEKKMKECILYANDLGLGQNMKFFFLPGGKTLDDGSYLLGRRQMQRIIEIAKQWGDYVILDSAPAGILTDAVVLAQYADAGIFVVRKDFASVDYIMDGMEHLAESRVQIIGSILNGA